MAKGFWRGQAAQWDIFKHRLGEYMGGLGGEQFQNILGSLAEARAPEIENIFGKYMGRAASLGQAVPGEMMSSAGLGGMEDLMAKTRAALVGEALGTYRAPWQGIFGGISGLQQQYMGTRGPGFGGFAGALAGMGLGALTGGAGMGLGMAIPWERLWD